ncbi:hypothetical protein IR120_02275 [Muribacter muris]|uniref:hypothetical protein n=1 Tax=Muribacter muris TaxID=67855 RepID=UPI0018836D4A|nr:hypothetical protein [Muribacter muris]MBF0784300.1 hypothetical protein [Muribacter muris]
MLKSRHVLVAAFFVGGVQCRNQRKTDRLQAVGYSPKRANFFFNQHVTFRMGYHCIRI